MKCTAKLTLCFLAFVLLMTSSCVEQNSTKPLNYAESIQDGTLAVVTTKFVNEGCEVLLEIEEEGKTIQLMPIELDERYRIDGLQIRIKFHSSRLMQSKCQLGRPIVLDYISFVDKIN